MHLVLFLLKVLVLLIIWFFSSVWFFLTLVLLIYTLNTLGPMLKRSLSNVGGLAHQLDSCSEVWVMLEEWPIGWPHMARGPLHSWVFLPPQPSLFSAYPSIITWFLPQLSYSPLLIQVYIMHKRLSRSFLSKLFRLLCRSFLAASALPCLK